MKTYTPHSFIFLFPIMSKNKEGNGFFIARMSSAYLSKPLVKYFRAPSKDTKCEDFPGGLGAKTALPMQGV